MSVKSPSTLVTAWLLVPLLVTLAAAGLGLGLQLLSRLELRALTVPAGFLAGIALMSSALKLGLGGVATTVLCAAAAATGPIVWSVRAGGRLRIRRPPAGATWAAAGALATFAIGISPLVGSGRSGLVGYVLNNDSAFHISLVESLRQHGTETLAGTDSFQIATQALSAGYPIGNYPWPMFGGLAGGIETFHVWSPLIALTAAMTALVAFAFLRRLGAPPAFAAVAGVAVASGYLPFSYLAQGGAKEVIMPLAVYGTVALAVRALDEELTWRSLLPAAFATAAAIANFGYGALAWLGPAGLLVLTVLLARARRRRSLRELRALVPYAAIALPAALPFLISSVRFVRDFKGEFVDPAEIGNLLAPLKLTEALNVWLASDYRFSTPELPVLTWIGIALAGGFAAAGLIHALARRELGIPLALIVGAAGSALISPRVSIYFDAKTYVVLAVALGMATAAGLLWLHGRSRLPRPVALAPAVLLLAGVLASNALVYAGVWVTPKARFEELRQINDRFAGEGPTLMHEREEYGIYLLRDVRPWDDWGERPVARGFRYPGNYPPPLPHAPDFDDYTLEHLSRFELLVERKRPGGSRPPASFRAVLETPHYRVWRSAGAPPRSHLALGTGTLAGSQRLRCGGRRVRALVRAARRTGSSILVAPGPRRPFTAVPFYRWGGHEPARVVPPLETAAGRGGTASATRRPSAGDYLAYVRGSFGPGVRLYVEPGGRRGGPPVADVLGDLGLPDAWQSLARLRLDGRTTKFTLVGLERSFWLAGSRHFNLIGPLVLVPAATRPPIERVEPDEVERFCGREVDWLELPA